MCEKAKYYERVPRRWRPLSHRRRAYRAEEEAEILRELIARYREQSAMYQEQIAELERREEILELRKQAERDRERIAELERQLEELRPR